MARTNFLRVGELQISGSIEMHTLLPHSCCKAESEFIGLAFPLSNHIITNTSTLWLPRRQR
jgi:hypothetical protein